MCACCFIKMLWISSWNLSYVPHLLKQGVVLFLLSKLLVSGLAFLMSPSKCASVAAAPGFFLLPQALKSTVFLTISLFVYYIHVPKASIRGLLWCKQSWTYLILEAFTILRLWSLKFSLGLLLVLAEGAWAFRYTWKYVEDDQKGSLIYLSPLGLSGALFSVLVAFGERNSVTTFCFLSCTFSHFLELFISCFTEVKFTLLIMWKGQREPLKDWRIAIENT